jgi:Membrane protein putatively involved in post-translational modification of the autoinducing quorum-sensing peptide
MKYFLVKKCMNLIKNKQPHLTSEDLEKIEYGLAGVYLSATKLIVIAIVAMMLGQLKETLFFVLIYALIKTHSYGVHATKSWICLISSILIFIPIPWIAMRAEIPFLIKYIVGAISTIMIFKNSPADTYKRPIINKQKRLKHKLLATLTALIFIIFSVLITNHFIANCFILAILLQSLISSPVVYSIFKLPFNNYLRYSS